jgi:23S rRNA (cytidine1920-2'-O)/16S rRNA (cytidine1409-2'-O)-methyltransferase
MHVRDLDASTVGGPVDLIVADLSFISLTRAIAPLLRVALPGADLVLLVKPQFEAGREEVGRGKGVITDPAVHARVRDEIAAALQASGCTVLGWVDSPITGGSGNREFLVHAVAPREGCP